MFRRRRNSQKPASELYAAFTKAFPQLRPGTREPLPQATSSNEDAPALLTTASMDQILDTSKTSNANHAAHRDHESSLIDPDHWRFSPSVMDASTFNFSSFVNQTPGELTPTPGAFHGGYHSQAGDLHTPGAPFQLETPLSTDTSHPISAIDMHAFHPHLLHSQNFHETSTFQQQPQQTYAPSTFMHRDSGYDTMDQSNNDYTDSRFDEDNTHSDGQELHSNAYSAGATSHMPSLEKFRFHVTLNAPTAMVKSAEEIPITYLNKGQAYALSINDSVGLVPTAGPVKYRTVVRISFEDEQQRQKPSQSWQLWKEGRGLAEAHQRDGKLQAVEYVDPTQGGDIESRKPRVELEAASFDCFSVLWSPTPGSSAASCSVSVRFNFLSTDFSHSKGVKGIPVRLCAKTEVISSGTPDSPPSPTTEVCFCKVKLFRDHGAERKLSNDIAHIKKTIDKLKQQITQIESGIKDSGKRKRSGSMATSNRVSKVHKHKRTWSISSQGSNGRPAVEDDLHVKLATMQDMFSSTRPVSVLYLRGYDDDDPDVFPVSLPGEPLDLTKVDVAGQKPSWNSNFSNDTSPSNHIISPTPSSRSAPSDTRTKTKTSLQDGSLSQSNTNQASDPWANFAQISHTKVSDASHAEIKVPRLDSDGKVPNWINAYGVDPSYQAPSERTIKPVACFYVLIKIAGKTPGEDYYRAVYLMERTVSELISSISIKCGVHPDNVARILRINPRGLKIVVDDEVVRELPEGQDMIVEFCELGTIKNEPGSGASTPKASTQLNSTRLEMRLVF